MRLPWLCWLFLLALAVIRRLQLQLVELRQQAGYWRALHQRAVLREAKLAQEIQRLQGELRALKRRVYGRRSETSSSTKPPNSPTVPAGTPKRARGQQRGSKGHGRRNHDHLPTTHEVCDLPDDQKCCPHCQLPFEEIPGTADGDILEIEVRAHRRRYHRKRYRRRCQCPGTPALVTAPPPDKLIPKSSIGISLWVMILQHKFAFFQPLYRVLAELRSCGQQLSAGTITGGLQKLVPLFQPLYELLVEHNRRETHWHCDETRWLVFVKHQDKANFIWYLWVFAGQESIVFVLDPTRAHDVPEDHFGDDAAGHRQRRSLQRLQGHGPGQSGPHHPGVLLGPRAPRLPGRAHRLAGIAPTGPGPGSKPLARCTTAMTSGCQCRTIRPAFAQADQLVRAQVEHLRAAS